VIKIPLLQWNDPAGISQDKQMAND